MTEHKTWWHPEELARRQPYLKARQKIIRAVREFFDSQDFDEVQTPILQRSPGMDTHIHGFATDIKGIDLKICDTLYLHTSPEFAMKKLMTGGVSRLYQVCPVFRNAESSRLHSPEFTMLEWYRARTDYRAMMEDCIGLLRFVAKKLDISEYRYRGKAANPFADWEKISVAEAFEQYGGIDLSRWLEDVEGFRTVISEQGIRTAPDDRWDDLFFRVMAEKIEPFLGMERPAILYDYPASMAALSRRKPDDPRYAERFEMYVCGVELCNAFSELTDANEQRLRFEEEMAVKQKLYGERYPVDEGFIAALTFGMPESSGNALGVDRLVMLATNAEDIRDVLWTAPPGSRDLLM